MNGERTIVEELADRLAISDQIYRYCRAMDRMDHALGYSVWHEDGTADYGESNYVGSGRGFVDHVNRQHAGLLAHSHQVTNILIELDGDTAGSETYVTATLQMQRDDKRVRMLVLSRYIDCWSRRGGRWAIDHRIALMDLGEVAEVTPMTLHQTGSRDLADPSYRVLPRRQEPAA